MSGADTAPGLALTFDDAYADFYAYVYPLLQEFSLRAVLAIPTAFIIERTVLSLPERMAVAGEQAMQGGVFRTKAPFCTWDELRLMAGSGSFLSTRRTSASIEGLNSPGLMPNAR